ncbi:MAG TPA: hypothetical protein VHD56_01535 [Tepidisphaeraceae bacterium]|nr:hypothetical protein [Tepidisphaeraceae bacterium]
MSKLKAIALLSGVVLSVTGCSMQCPIQHVNNSVNEPQSQAPMLVDEAMQNRDWNRSEATYANGNIIAGPTGFLYQTRWDQPTWVYPLEESPLFVGQTIGLPITLTRTPPWTPILYKGGNGEPTYTAMPPLSGTINRPVR